VRLGRILSWLSSSRNIQDGIEAEAIQFNIERCQESATDAAMTGSGYRLRVPARAKAEAEDIEGTAPRRVAQRKFPGITLAICRLAHPVFAFPVSCFLFRVSVVSVSRLCAEIGGWITLCASGPTQSAKGARYGLRSYRGDLLPQYFNAQGPGKWPGAFISSWRGTATNREVLSSMLSAGGRLPQSAR
jgi:hypothetical protein